MYSHKNMSCIYNRLYTSHSHGKWNNTFHQILWSVHKKLFKGGQQHNLMARPSSGRLHLWFQHNHCDNNIQIHIDFTTTIYITSFIDSDIIKD